MNGLESEGIAVFDVCGTLYRSNTTFDFLSFFLGKTSRYRQYSTVLNSPPFRLGNSLLWRAVQRDLRREMLLRLLSGYSRPTLFEAAKKFVCDYLKNRKFESTHELLETFCQKGLKIVLVSASINFVVEAIANELGHLEFLATELEFRRDICTGKIASDLLGKKLVAYQNRWGHCGVPVVVTNDRSDLPLVQYASRAFIVARKKELAFWQRNAPHAKVLHILES